MIIGVPKEIKSNENRVAVTPAGTEAFTKSGHQVFIETKAGIGSGFADDEYREAGAEILPGPAEIFAATEMIMKVKEPLPAEYDLFKPGQVIFTYLHLAAEEKLTLAMLAKKVVGIAYETIELADGTLPLLTPMSEVAGKMSVQVGASFLEKAHGGRGVLLGGVPGVLPGKVVIIGGGTVGANAAKIAVGMGADVVILDNNFRRLQELDDLFGSKVKTLMSNNYNIKETVVEADLLVGAVLITGGKAPRLVTEDMVREMQPGAVIVDVAIDQGGCIETCDRITTHANPTFIKHGVVHYSVANMPGSVARTSTLALTNVTLPYGLRIADVGYKAAIKAEKSIAEGVNVIEGKLTYKGVAEALELVYTPLEDVISVK